MDVSPFSDEYAAMKDVPIASAATAVDDKESGETIILEFHQGLWFGTRMENSLINPNQCRAFGIELCDDPFDSHRSLGIRAEDVEIPFKYSKNVVYWDTRAPSIDEINNPELLHITMTSEKPWVPSTISRELSKEEEEYKRLLAHVRIDQRLVSAVTPREPQVASDKKEYDILMASCSSIYSDPSLMQRLVSSVRVASPLDSETRNVSSLSINERHANITAEELSRKLFCGIETAQQTLKVTTQRGIRHAVHPLSRRYRTDIMQIRSRTLSQTFYTDTMFSKYKSLSGNTCAQIITNGRFMHPEPLVSKSRAGEAMVSFGHEVGIPDTLVYDGASEQCGRKTEFNKWVRKHQINTRNTEPHSSWQNKAENGIRMMRSKWRSIRRTTRCSPRLWDFGFIHLARLMNKTWRSDLGRTPYEEVTGETPDISEDIDFQFYDWVWYWDHPGDEDSPHLGRWLGVSHRVGAAMCYWVLTEKGTTISRSTVQHVTKEERLQDTLKASIEAYDRSLKEKLDDEMHIQENNNIEFYLDDVGELDNDSDDVVPMEKSLIPEADDFTPDSYDTLLGASLQLPNPDGTTIRGTVRKRKLDNNGNPIGVRHQSPMLDTRLYEVELSDGTIAEYYANVIAENMLSQVDSEGRQHLLMEEITDHKKSDAAIAKDDGWIETSGNQRRRKKTTKGWKLYVKWKDQSHDWIPLKDLKESYPVQVAEYAKAAGIDDEPAFAWWVNTVIRKRNRIINKVKSRYWKTTHKFGIELPHSVLDAIKIDEKNGNTLWQDAVEKEMQKVRGLGTFERWDKATPDELRETPQLLPGFQEITCHMVFDVKMDGKFTRKARFVADGHKTQDVPAHATYASVVSRESVRLAFLHAALNNLDVLSCDVSNAFLNAPCKEKIWIPAGREFGSDEGSVMIIRKAAYGLKSSGNSWRQVMSQFITETLGFQNTIADPDVYRRESRKPDGTSYYELLLVYVDDLLCVSHNPKDVMDKIGLVWDLKDTVKEPDRYLGANIKKRAIGFDNREVWGMDGHEYVGNAVRIVEEMLAKEEKTLRLKGTNRPFHAKYKPEVDVTPALDSKLSGRFSQLIGMLRWAVELGRVDILLETSLLSSHLALPREGHLEAVYQVFAYLKRHQKAPIWMDDKVPTIDERQFKVSDWSTSIYQGAYEETPPKMPKPLGNPIQMVCFVDASHANDVVTRRSQTGFIIYVNNSPIDWFSKKQSTVESSTFGSEFVAMRIAMERCKALRYKLKMFGFPIEGPTWMLGDNQSVVNSASLVERKLNKKHNAICFHAVREAVAAKWLMVGWEPTGSNIADIFTKVLNDETRAKLLSSIFIRLYAQED